MTPYRLLAGLVFVVVAGLRGGGLPAVAQTPDRAAIVQQWFDTRNAWDEDGILGMMTENPIPIIVGGPCHTETPCVGLDAIRQVVEVDIAGHIQFTVHGTTVYGNAVVGQIEVRNDAICAAGTERIIDTYLITVIGGKIATYVALVDTTDAQTLQYISVVSGQRPAGPPCTGTTLPASRRADGPLSLVS